MRIGEHGTRILTSDKGYYTINCVREREREREKRKIRSNALFTHE